MKNLRHLSVYFSGNKIIDPRLKYSAVSFCLSFVHFLISIFFLTHKINALGLYNLVITGLYFYFGLRLKSHDLYKSIYYFSICEVALHSITATILVGYEWGFMSYTLALVPVPFYFSTSSDKFKHKFIPSIVSSGIVFLLLVFTKIFCHFIPPEYDGYASNGFALFMYCFNMFVSVTMLTLFTVLFALEVKYVQHNLEHRNRILNRLASQDPLTMLLNRRSMKPHLNEAFNYAKESGTRFTIILADIDNFKKVNDTYGHDSGDVVLKYVASTIVSIAGINNYACRWGGEEFLLLIPDSFNKALDIAEKICSEIAREPVKANEFIIPVTITLGMATYDNNSSVDELFNIADSNMYKGKLGGKNRVVY